MEPQIEKLLFVTASSLVEASDRRAFLDFVCHGDEELRKELEELLEVQRDADELFELQPEMTPPTAPLKGARDAAEGELGARIGPYRLIDRLGSGGCGVVYLAEQTEPVRRKVALKIIRLGLDTENVITRFAMEREALALMDHPNIARVLDAGSTASGRPYFVMELVDGDRITEFCDTNRLDLRERLQLFISVCEAIQHAHQKGVIHRDIKPSNVLVRQHDGKVVPKVIDFGIAKATAGDPGAEVTFTRTGQLMGTPAYMSPEQAEGNLDIDTRSDIYSLGALLCELLTGQTPFDQKRFKDRGVEEIRHILRDEVTSLPSTKLMAATGDERDKIAAERGVEPQRLTALLSGDLDWIVAKAVEKDRRHRYETANELAMDVSRFLREEPVLARPPSRGYALMKLVRRHRLVFTAGAVALSGLLAGLGVSTWLFVRERDARQEQSRLRSVAERARAIAEDARANESRMSRAAQTADLVTQAAVFLKYDEIEKADKAISGLNVDDIPASLEAASTLIKLANWNITQKQWKNAAQRFYALAHVFADVDPKDTNINSQEWLPMGAAVFQWGEAGQYHEVRRLAIARFSHTKNRVVAEHLLKVSLLEPLDENTLRAVAPMAGVIESALTDRILQKDIHLNSWGRCALALLTYRQGKLEKSREWAQLSLKNVSESSRVCINHVILALVDLRQGKGEQANTKLNEARVLLKQWESGELLSGGSSNKLTWVNWEIARILLKEAEAMLAENED